MLKAYLLQLPEPFASKPLINGRAASKCSPEMISSRRASITSHTVRLPRTPTNTQTIQVRSKRPLPPASTLKLTFKRVYEQSEVLATLRKVAAARHYNPRVGELLLDKLMKVKSAKERRVSPVPHDLRALPSGRSRVLSRQSSASLKMLRHYIRQRASP
jgi:hypothetical protein